jgi:micrococcal nuclease
MRRSRKAAPLAIVVLALLVWLARGPLKNIVVPGPAPSGEWRVVVRVVDGDTLVLDGGERVRLIGVNTPETKDPRRPVEYFGKEASAFVRRVAEGKRARLEYDQERADRYGRTLAYVYLEDGTFLNAEIIRQGYGHAYTRFPFRYADEFRAYEREARENNRGLWAR